MTPSTSHRRSPRLARPSRLLAVAAAVLIGLSFLFPLWTLHLTAPQYPETLNLHVYAYKFEGSANPVLNDIQEINTLNHYIGMAEIHAPDFPELRILPTALTIAAVLILLAAALGSWQWLAVATVLLAVTGGGGMASAYYKLYSYGHHLSSSAPLKVPGFTPPLLGSNRLVNFMTTGMFDVGGFMLILAGILLLVALYLYWKPKEA